MRRRHLLATAPALLAAACTAPAPAPPAIAVFFTADSASLDGEAAEVVRRAAAAARGGTGPVTVLGFAGPAGGVAYNRALSEARAQHVADMLIANGVARERVRIVPRGPVPFEAMATESRRVEIRIGG
ncbi:OmpA family protein [Roseomonas alkaliterrae]|uniref:Outer membrane protein OmpA-like peptidoglycan-associated protein n=1 Tax=Neoroseomonas alkaliterrae TaxID=1452450 RepID=A0A840Y669_9PROT|nr:OmpA family protein [Neoroseomonas alkaliterrae]MBB5689583.1 outer membrane protein OmpA-like peptidoglycan-associated protein [Neoroseomonas alkaliterrae]MBR0676987.1 OmpA family protein [Neoroseomonas alkaliterrae]